MINRPHTIRTISVLVKKELAAYFNSPIAYIVAAVFLAVGNWLFWKPFFLLGEASLRAYFNMLPWLLLFLIPALAMRLWADEKKSGTIELLLTLPITDWQIVLAKFIGSLIFIWFILLLTISLPLSVSGLGRLDLGAFIASYFGAASLSVAFLAVGLLISSLTKNQIIAFIGALAGCFLLFIMGSAFMLSGLPTEVEAVLAYIGLSGHYYSMIKGVVDTKDILYFLSFVTVFLWLNALVLSWRKQ